MIKCEALEFSLNWKTGEVDRLYNFPESNSTSSAIIFRNSARRRYKFRAILCYSITRGQKRNSPKLEKRKDRLPRGHIAVDYFSFLRSCPCVESVPYSSPSCPFFHVNSLRVYINLLQSFFYFLFFKWYYRKCYLLDKSESVLECLILVIFKPAYDVILYARILLSRWKIHWS